MSPIQFKDYYSVLGVDRGADEKAIQRAFRERARKLHPDVNRDDPSAEEKFKELNEAYDVLSDKEKRQRYDMFGSDWERYQHADTAPNAGPFTSTRRQAPPDGDFEAWFTGDPADGQFEYRERSGRFSEFFDLLFGGQQGGSARSSERGGFRLRRRRGEDLEIVTSVSLREAVTGATRQVSINAPDVCATCNGTGLARGVECPTCDGTGTVTRVKRLEVTIPPGVHTGSRVRVAGQGGPGVGGGPNGDVYLAITVAPDSRFTIKGNNLVTKAKVPMYTAILGGEIEVDTVESRVAMNIPPGTQNGRTFKLRGKGLPNLGSKSGERGDLLVQTEIVVPENLTERERELFTELRNLRQ
jgi:molecular chaperone DnaJ/curved DNA-binding protein